MIYDAEQFALDAEARLNSLDFFSCITVRRYMPGDTLSEVLDSISTANEKGGKVGACVVVMPPEESVPDADMVGPMLDIKLSVHVFTDVLLNLSDMGTKNSNAVIRRNVRSALHHFIPNGAQAIYCDKNGGRPLNLVKGVEIYEIDFILPLPEPFVCAFLPPPIITGTAEAVSISSMTAGAQLWYSLDGSFPSPISSALYANPISVPPGTTIRAAAYLSGSPGSSVAVKTIT